MRVWHLLMTQQNCAVSKFYSTNCFGAPSVVWNPDLILLHLISMYILTNTQRLKNTTRLTYYYMYNNRSDWFGEYLRCLFSNTLCKCDYYYSINNKKTSIVPYFPNSKLLESEIGGYHTKEHINEKCHRTLSQFFNPSLTIFYDISSISRYSTQR